MLRILIGFNKLVVRIHTLRKLGGIQTYCVQGGLQKGLLLAQVQQVLLGNHVQPIHACVPSMLCRVSIFHAIPSILTCLMSNSREYFLQSWGILNAMCGCARKSRWGVAIHSTFRRLLIDMCASLKTLDFTHSWLATSSKDVRVLMSRASSPMPVLDGHVASLRKQLRHQQQAHPVHALKGDLSKRGCHTL